MVVNCIISEVDGMWVKKIGVSWSEFLLLKGGRVQELK